MTRLARNTTFLTVATIGQKIVAFVYFALIARIVGVEWTGTYFLALSITTMVGVIADFGLTPVLVRDAAKHPQRERELLGAIFGLKIGLTIVAALVAVMVTHAFDHDAHTRQLVYMATVVMALDTVHLTCFGVFRARHRLGIESLGIFVGMVITLVVGVASLLIRPSLPILIIALVAGSSWNVGYVVWHLVRRDVRPWRVTWYWPSVKRLLRIAWPFALAAIFVKIYSTTDALLLEWYLGEAAVGLYAIAYKLTYAFQFFPLAFVAALYPTFSAQIQAKDRDALLKTFEDAFWYMLMLSVPVILGLWAVADVLIPAVYGLEFVGSIQPFRILIFVLFFIFLDFPIGALLNADDRQHVKTFMMGGTMVINVALNVLLIPRFGIIGACIAALVGFAFLFGAGLVAARTSLPYDGAHLIKRGAPIVLSGLVMALTVLLLKSWIGLGGSVVLGAIVYGGGLLATRSLTLTQIKQFVLEWRT